MGQGTCEICGIYGGHRSTCEKVKKVQSASVTGLCCSVMDDCQQLQWVAGDKERLASALREIYNIRGEDEDIAKIVNEALDQGCAT